MTCVHIILQLGATVEEGPDYCVITPPEKLNITAIDTYDDHRMAMAFSLAACAEVPVTIKDPGCTRKTFPDYFEVLGRFTQHWVATLLEAHSFGERESERWQCHRLRKLQQKQLGRQAIPFPICNIYLVILVYYICKLSLSLLFSVLL